MKDPFRRKSRLHRVIIITIPLGGSVITGTILAVGFIAASSLFPLGRIAGNTISMAVSLLSIIMVVIVRRQSQNFKRELTEWAHEVTTLDTEDPALAEPDAPDIIRLPDRRNTSGS